ncbi:MAG TPA: V-type ATP synthase subunit A [Methanomicrobia archaeon]|nr:V-type ATP synthase subunit A [Methanomicrobia archaeon]
MEGKIIRISGPVVEAVGMKGSKMYELVKVSEEELMGEIIQLYGDKAIIQVYEDTTSLKPGEKIIPTGRPLSVKLGVGLTSGIYDGVQRPLNLIRDQIGDFIKRGVKVEPLIQKKKWHFVPLKNKGDKIKSGDIIGYVRETELIEHRILVPPDFGEGKLEYIEEGDFTINDPVAKTEDKDIKMYHEWPVRKPRSVIKKFEPSIPLLTGQRVLDTFFPIAKGGTAAIPGGFGTGKTVIQHQLAKWADAEVVVYVGCGERGNEMTDVLTEFPELKDPKTGRPLMERTVLIANTSNMPVAAREASIYTGVTIGEYYRDMGYNVALMADSTSRWAEALREISGRLEEMPGEEGYPAYLASKLAEFYERSGRVVTLNGKEGSLSIIGAVSPPGSDFSEPVTQNTLRVTKVFWALDRELKDRRHFPSINWLTSYSLYLNDVKNWWDNVSKDWSSLRIKAMQILQKEEELKEIVQLVGPDALPKKERLLLEAAKILREDFLQQNAFHKIDTYCSQKKQVWMLRICLMFYEKLLNVIDSIEFEDVAKMKVKEEIARMKIVPEEEVDKKFTKIEKDIAEEIEKLRSKSSESG